MTEKNIPVAAEFVHGHVCKAVTCEVVDGVGCSTGSTITSGDSSTASTTSSSTASATSSKNIGRNAGSNTDSTASSGTSSTVSARGNTLSRSIKLAQAIRKDLNNMRQQHCEEVTVLETKQQTVRIDCTEGNMRKCNRRCSGATALEKAVLLVEKYGVSQGIATSVNKLNRPQLQCKLHPVKSTTTSPCQKRKDVRQKRRQAISSKIIDLATTEIYLTKLPIFSKRWLKGFLLWHNPNLHFHTTRLAYGRNYLHFHIALKVLLLGQEAPKTMQNPFAPSVSVCDGHKTRDNPEVLALAINTQYSISENPSPVVSFVSENSVFDSTACLQPLQITRNLLQNQPVTYQHLLALNSNNLHPLAHYRQHRHLQAPSSNYQTSPEPINLLPALHSMFQKLPALSLLFWQSLQPTNALGSPLPLNNTFQQLLKLTSIFQQLSVLTDMFM
ncbi:hypothetical protein Pelo_13724 [Pelomyxa schiedti]|nr:hypothetical protein Pelo_13724 [Pelomyxa schiedti]